MLKVDYSWEYSKIFSILLHKLSLPFKHVTQNVKKLCLMFIQLDAKVKIILEPSYLWENK
jgi:hypothetical protein